MTVLPTRAALPAPVVLALVLLALAPHAHAQLLADTSFAWQSYSGVARCQLSIYAAAPGEDRSRVVVLRELAKNRGPSITADARHLAELIGRAHGIAPDDAYWVFHWGAFSFPEAADSRKEVFLRATFRQHSGGGFSTPSWRVISREETEELTDRAFR